MRNLIIATSVISILGLTAASAQDFRPSEPDSGPRDRMTVDVSAITSSVGAPRTPRKPAGFSAAQGFGPSDQDNQPTPRFQQVR